MNGEQILLIAAVVGMAAVVFLLSRSKKSKKVSNAAHPKPRPARAERRRR